MLASPYKTTEPLIPSTSTISAMRTVATKASQSLTPTPTTARGSAPAGASARTIDVVIWM